MAKALRHVYGPIGGLIIDGPKGLLRGTINAVAVAVGGPVVAAMQVVAAGASLLEPKPKAPPTLAQSSERLTLSINVREPRKIVLGSTAMATDIRDQEWSSDQKHLHRFIVVASHRVQAIREIWFDDKLVWTAAGGVQGDMAKWLYVATVLEGSAANAINIGPRMGSSRRYTGCAYIHLRYQIAANAKKVDSPFAQSIPSRVTIIGDGAPVYDPRRDSTVPGGSGPQRANDQSTWEWTESAGRNPALAMLFYLLGWRISGRLAVGKGLPPARINLASFIDAANLCDEPVAKASGGTEPRYRCDGVLSEGDATEAVLDNLKATMNAVLDDVDGRLRVTVLHNDLAAPIGELGTADVLGAFTWQQTLPLDDSVSVIRGSFVDPSPTSLYQQPDYPQVTIASRDGIERSQTVNYPLVQSASQAQRLSKQRLQRMLYGGTFTATFQSTAWKFQKGDVIRLTFLPLGWERKLFRIADMATQVDGKVPMMLRVEHPAIYAWDASDAPPVTGAEPTRYDPSLWPVALAITEAGTTAEWDKVGDPLNTKPEDNATRGAPVGTSVGGRPVNDVLAAIDAAKARQDALETITIPAINDAAAQADGRISAARTRADDAYGRAITAGDDAASVKRSVETLSSQASPSGGNLCPNSTLSTLDGWGLSYDVDGAGKIERDAAGAYWMIGGVEHNIALRRGPGASGLWGEAQGPIFAVRPGSTIQAYALIAAHRTSGWFSIFFFDAAMNFVGYGGEHFAERQGNGGNNANGWDITGVKEVLVPSTAVRARVVFRGYDATADAYVWCSRPFATEVKPGTTTWVPYSAGNDAAVTAAIDARVTREIATLADADRQLAQASTELETRMGNRVSATARDVTTAFTEADQALSRRATALEASAGETDAALFGAGGVLGRIKTSEDTLADLPNRYAATSRTAVLESQLNFATDSGLKRALSTQIEDRATTIASEKAGSVAQTVSALRSEYDQTKADLSIVGSVASDAYGRSRAFLQQKAVAGNNRAQLTLYADSNGGGGVDIIGDVSISGDLLVMGTVRARAFDRSSMSREGRTTWIGPATPGQGQTINLPGLGLPSIPPQGRFFYEVRAVIETNAGQSTSTSINGQPAYMTYQDDGGFLIRAIDGQGNHYVPRVNASTNEVVVASSDFNPNFAVTVSRGSLDTGWVHDGDYYHREVSATYTVRSYDLRVTWIAV